MTTTINASATNGLVATADGSGIVKLQSNGVTTNSLAWCFFTASGATPTVRSSYNVSSITNNSTGDWTATFTVSMTNATYCPSGFARISGAGGMFQAADNAGLTTTTIRFGTFNNTGTISNPVYASFTIHGN